MSDTTQHNPEKSVEGTSATAALTSTIDSSVKINIIAQSELNQCPFWLGVFQPGTILPSRLLDTAEIREVFLRAATEGLAEPRSLLLTDTSQEDPRFFYFVPQPESFYNIDSWIEGINRTIVNLKLNEIGIYLAPEIVNKDHAQSLLKRLLTTFVRSTGIQFYHLYPGGHGTSSVLNAALDIKSSLETDASRIYVFH